MIEARNGETTHEFDCGCVVTAWYVDSKRTRLLFRTDRECADVTHPLNNFPETWGGETS